MGQHGVGLCVFSGLGVWEWVGYCLSLRMERCGTSCNGGGSGAIYTFFFLFVHNADLKEMVVHGRGFRKRLDRAEGEFFFFLFFHFFCVTGVGIWGWG